MIVHCCLSLHSNTILTKSNQILVVRIWFFSSCRNNMWSISGEDRHSQPYFSTIRGFLNFSQRNFHIEWSLYFYFQEKTNISLFVIQFLGTPSPSLIYMYVHKIKYYIKWFHSRKFKICKILLISDPLLEDNENVDKIAHHVYDLLECQPECEDNRVSLIVNWSL